MHQAIRVQCELDASLEFVHEAFRNETVGDVDTVEKDSNGFTVRMLELAPPICARSF